MYPHQQQEQQTGGGAAGEARSASGACACAGFPPLDDLSDLPVRRLLRKLEDELETHRDRPTDATRKLEEDVKALTKEYAGLGDLVTKYQAFHEKVDCLLAEAARERQETRQWCAAGGSAEAIQQLWTDFYEAVENEACAKWIAARTSYGTQLDCLRQAERAADEAKEDYDTAKIFERSVKERFTQLSALFKQGKTFYDSGQHNSACAVSLEYCAAFNQAAVLDSWERRRRCGAPPASSNGGGSGGGETDDQGGGASGREARGGGASDASQQGGGSDYPEPGAGSPCDAEPEQDLKTYWTVERYQSELTSRLRALILARYVYFRWWQQRLELESESKRLKEALDRFRKSRQADFIREAADATADNRRVVNA